MVPLALLEPSTGRDSSCDNEREARSATFWRYSNAYIVPKESPYHASISASRSLHGYAADGDLQVREC